ncbi:MAG: UDP-N-acetylmuramate:L-alanyl-gamma-D-glutamyl-meso-diaminopimelate ligase [Tatlockia sp.]|nr:UDP-N-acetylmuramate:L-alanyl-gamma-D-glutamyl-meso-diaminopimelate ligase [Tatlockia sp.]
MHIHILGIGGTFMSALALLAREAGHQVTGCDENCYPPISDLLKAKGIEWTEGYQVSAQALSADQIIVGNAIKRGMPVLEAILNAGKNYSSGPQWLAENILSRYRVIAISGTHGKTTTTTMLSFILEKAGLQPGFLIGGIAPNFNTNARLGKGDWFVIEADEYDSAFFDKRPKFMHYRPEIAILNNLEFDHADIYENLAAIQQQFHYFLKTIPAKGVVIKPRDDQALNEVIKRGLFCRLEELAFDNDACWRAELLKPSGQSFRVWYQGKSVAEVNWSLIGKFNVENALAALAVSHHAGVDLAVATQALTEFKPVKRRLEVKSDSHGITVYDDFAHHPTAISKTISALKLSGRHQRIFAVLEFASYTMKTGIHAEAMAEALSTVNGAFVLNPAQFDLATLAKEWPCPHQILGSIPEIVEALIAEDLQAGDAILIMSNRGFGNIYEQLISKINSLF